LRANQGKGGGRKKKENDFASGEKKPVLIVCRLPISSNSAALMNWGAGERREKVESRAKTTPGRAKNSMICMTLIQTCADWGEEGERKKKIPSPGEKGSVSEKMMRVSGYF